MAGFPFNYCFWNARGVRGKLPELEKLVADIQVVGIGETRLLAGEKLCMAGFDVQSGGLSPGVALGVRYWIPHRWVTLPPCAGVCSLAVQLWSKGHWVTVVAVYVSGDFSEKEWELWVGSMPRPVIVAGDFNAHHVLWGSARQNRRGAIIANSLGEQGLSVLNDGTSTFVRWYAGVCQESVLDLALCSWELTDVIALTVSDDLRGSDHLPILIAGKGVSAGLPRVSGGGHTAEPLPVQGVVSGVYGDFLGRWGLQRRVFSQSNRVKRAVPPWWTRDCRIAIRNRRREYRRFLRQRTLECWRSYLRVAGETKRVIRSAKRSFGARVCQLAAGGTSLSKMWQMVSPRKQLSGISWAFATDGVSVLRGRALAEGMADHFMAVYSGSHGKPCVPAVSGVDEHSSLEAPIAVWEVEAALQSSRDGAAGVDGVTYASLRSLSAIGLGELTQLFCKVWDGDPIPDAWKFAIVSPLRKAGKQRFLLRSYRPISLLSCVGKVYEKVLISRLDWYVERVGGLHETQFGFRKGRSAQDAVLLLESGVREAWARGAIVLAVFLDIRAAYDTVVISWVIAGLRELGVSEKLIKALQTLLVGRVFVTRVGQTFSSPRYPSRGLPQGSCLSPLLFALVLNPLLVRISAHANIAAFADDVALWLVGYDLGEMISLMEEVVADVVGWFQCRGMGLSQGKTQVMVFSKSAVPTFHLKVGEELIESVTEVRYLGMVLDPSLSWIADSNGISSNIRGASRILSSLVGRPGCRRKFLRQFYSVFIQSRADYHLPFLCGTPAAIRRVQIAVNECLRLVTGCLRTTSIAALHVEAGCMPQVWRAKCLLLRMILRNLGRGECDVLGRILFDYCTLGKKERNLLGTAGLGIELVQGSILKQFSMCCVRVPVGPWILGPCIASCVVHSCCEEDLQVFCDASFSAATWSGGVGVWVPVVKRGFSWRFSYAPSAFVLELAGISLAIDVGMSLGVKAFVVRSDSLAGIKFLASQFRNMCSSQSPLAWEVGHKLFGALQCGVAISICWVPGHTGVFGNEMADTCSRFEGEGVQVVDARVILSARDLHPVVVGIVREWWDEEWLGESKGRDLFALHPSVQLPRTLDALPRADAALLSRLRTGHVLLNSFSHGLGLVASPICRCGEGEESVVHFLLTCPLWAVHRARLRQVIGQELSLGNVLGVWPHNPKGTFRSLRATLRFCRESGRFTANRY